jgi:hypothetical protein
VPGETSQLAPTATAAKILATESTVASVEVNQSAAVQSNVAPLPTTSAQPVAVQVTVPGETSQPVAKATATEPVEAHSSVSQTSVSRENASQSTVSQQAVIEPAVVSSAVAPANVDTSSNSAALPAAGIQEMQAPIATSAKSGNAQPSAVAAAAPDADPATSNSGVHDSPGPVVMNEASNADQSAVANDPTEITPAPVLRETAIASVKDVAAPATKTDSTVQADPQPAEIDRASADNTITVPSGIADQLAVPPQAVSTETTQASVTSLKPVSTMKPQAKVSSTASKGSSTEQTSAKKSAEPLSESESKGSSHDAASSGNQNQDGDAPQAQIATPVPVSFTVHPAAVIAAAQNATPVATNHAASASADAAGVAAMTTDNTQAQTSATLHQTAPVINTARLIQSMGQTEMRVGMRSNEFGNISISTSSIRDQVSTQISVEHGELARTLVSHLPEMQARLGSSQAIDVRIDMNGAATGQGTGNFGGMSNDTAGQSRGGRQQAGNIAASQSINSVVEQQFSPVVGTMPSGYARLDIRV